MDTTCRYGPDVPRVASRIGIPNGIGVPVIESFLGQEEDVLVGACWAIFHRLRNRGHLMPDDVGADGPTIGLKGKGKSPRDAHQGLDRYTFWLRRAHGAFPSAWNLFVRKANHFSSPTAVGIANIEEDSSCVHENALHLGENAHHV